MKIQVFWFKMQTFSLQQAAQKKYPTQQFYIFKTKIFLDNNTFMSSILILGCEGHPEDIYELVNTDGALSWKKMSQKLLYPRSHTISMLLPDNLVNCDFP